MTVTSLLDLYIKADQLDAAPALISETLKITRAFEGSLGVDVVVDVTDPSHFVLIEKWESLDRDDAYRAFRATPEGASKLRTIVASPPTLTRFTVADGV
jgi:quinol monooxygenase YgiN